MLTLADDTPSGQSTSSPPRSSPLSSIALGPLLATGIRLVGGTASAHPEPAYRHSSGRLPKSPTIRVYEEPLRVQLEREASAPASIEYPHDDKENPVEDIESEDEADLHDNITVQTALGINEERIGIEVDAAIDYVAPSMFDGSSDRMAYVHHNTSFPPIAQREALSDERDSVLGTLSPRGSFDRNCVSGDCGSDGAVGHGVRQKAPSGGFALLR